MENQKAISIFGPLFDLESEISEVFTATHQRLVARLIEKTGKPVTLLTVNELIAIHKEARNLILNPQKVEG